MLLARGDRAKSRAVCYCARASTENAEDFLAIVVSLLNAPSPSLDRQNDAIAFTNLAEAEMDAALAALRAAPVGGVAALPPAFGCGVPISHPYLNLCHAELPGPAL